jgi:putative phage-type endonuclease
LSFLAMLTVSQPQSERIVIAQDSSAWIKARIGHLTASRMRDVLDFTKAGKPSAARTKYLMELVAERLTDSAVDHYVTPDMQHGLDFEDEAAEAYCEVSGNDITRSGFMLHPAIEFCGASPDRFVNHDGLLEIKCPRTTTHISWMLAGVVPEEHQPQMTLQLAVSGRQWCDFVSFDPRVPPRQRVFIRRFTPSQEAIAHIEEAARGFLKEVDELFERVTT